jgi:uncharacterized protein YfaS (alpha-2-macroglobulin family)
MFANSIIHWFTVLYIFLTVPNPQTQLPHPSTYAIPKQQTMLNFLKKDYDKLWKEVDSLENKGLVESAAKKVAEIYDKAKAEENHDQFVKSVIFKLKFFDAKEDDATAKLIAQLEEEAEKAEFPIKPVLHSMIAELYWKYYEQNRWRFQHRTEVATFVPKDIRTWTLENLTDATIAQYKKSLENTAQSKATQLEIYHQILGGDSKTTPENFGKGRYRELRPTLYEFLAHRAVDFLVNTEAALTAPIYQYTIEDKAYFAPITEFVNLKIESKDERSMLYQGMKILQDIAKFRIEAVANAKENTSYPSQLDALIDLDLKRLRIIKENSVQPNKEVAYLQALENMQQNCGNSQLKYDIALKIAQYYLEKGKGYKAGQSEENRWALKKAKTIAEEVLAKEPTNYLASYFKSVIATTQNRILNIEVETVTPDQQAQRFLIKYRNLTSIYCKIVKIDHKKIEELQNDYNEREEKLKKYLQSLAEKPVATFDYDLPTDEGDMQEHSVEGKIEALPFGTYAILVSDAKDFDVRNHTTNYAIFSISNLSLTSKTENNGVKQFWVLHRNTGKPIADVEVTLSSYEYDYSARKYVYKLLKKVKTDANGYFETRPTKNSESFRVELKNGADELTIGNNFYVSVPYKNSIPTYTQTFFFTDRAIYRPNQTIFFKALVLSKTGDKSEILRQHPVTVTFYDVNYQKISDLQLTTNDYGTVSGSFTAPSDRLTGTMSLYSSANNYGGYHYVRVEEYKRPKFEVTYENVKGTFKLGEKVTIKGKAQAYSGANIDNAQVSYRVVRRARFPFWCWWWRWWQPPVDSPEMQITFGKTLTDANGNFEVTFEAVPDLTIDKKTNPVFDYVLTADITDLNGETQSGEKTVSVGYKSLLINTDIPTQLNLDTKPKEFSVTVENLNGETEKFQGNYTLFRLKNPNSPYKNRLWNVPDKFMLNKKQFEKDFPFDAYSNEDEMSSWEKTSWQNGMIDTEKSNKLVLNELQTGAYFIKIEGKDIFGEAVVYENYFTVFSPKAKDLAVPMTDLFVPLKTKCEVGETAQFLVGSSYKDVAVRYEVRQGSNVLETKELVLSNEQKTIEFAVKEEHRGNISLHTYFIRHGRTYEHNQLIQVPFTNKELAISFETFRNKLQPGEKEEWKIKIKGKQGDKVAAEMVAALYDASLDAFAPNNFNFNILSYLGAGNVWDSHGFGYTGGNILNNWQQSSFYPFNRSYDYLNWFGFSLYNFGYRNRRKYAKMSMSAGSVMKKGKRDEAEESDVFAGETEMKSAAPPLSSDETNEVAATALATDKHESNVEKPQNSGQKPKEKADLSAVKARTNFNETAFFEPHLQTDSEGNIVIKFTIPESLTKWKMLGFAHTQDLRYGFAQNTLVTQKDLMVVPNAPRFFRENDEIVFTTKITNLSDKDLSGEAKLELTDYLTTKPSPFGEGNKANSVGIGTPPLQMEEGQGVRSFTVKAQQSTVVAWSFKVPEGMQTLTYKIVAAAGTFSDGEEMTLPVLTNRMLVTETLPLPVRAKQTKEFSLNKLVENQSTTLRNHKLTVEFTSNPAWYAVQSLPYLMEYPYECSEQTFSRFYANSIATHLANGNPKIKAIFKIWKNTNSSELVSNLEKRQDLKAVLLEETPWVLQAKDETERKKRLGLLLDLVRMSAELERTITKLQKMQVPNGGFPWFDGMPDSRWITQHIVAGMGHLKQLGIIQANGTVSSTVIPQNENSNGQTAEMLRRAVRYLDDRKREDYERLVDYCKRNKLKLEDQRAGYDDIHYLYARSFFLSQEIDSHNQTAYNFYLTQAKKYWLENEIYAQGMISLVAHRTNDKTVAMDIVKSLKEKALQHEEMGMYWKDMMGGYYWYQAPIETQALLIEVFSEVANDKASVDEMKVWLLKNKQTNDWKTTKATAEACYALLLQGSNWLAESQLAEITVGKEKINFETRPDMKVEAGTGYFTTSWYQGEIKPEMGKVTVTNKNEVVAWGGLYWQYFEQLDKITPAETPLKLNKQLFIERDTDTGKKLEALTNFGSGSQNPANSSKPTNFGSGSQNPANSSKPTNFGSGSQNPANSSKLKVGDIVKVRIELRVDRPMEYIHLKDMRASCFEPVNVLSSYKYQDGLGYYEATRDAATNFFISYLPAGTYVFEYPLKVTHEGDFSNGITTIQCMYAPEFSSHSEGIRVRVEK